MRKQGPRTKRIPSAVCSLVVLTVGSARCENASTHRPRLWPYGLYDRLFRSRPKPTDVNGVRIERLAPKTVIIYRGTQPETVDLTATNHLAPPKPQLRIK